MKQLCGCWTWRLVAVFALCGAAVFWTMAGERADPILKTIIRGVEFNESLIDRMDITITKEWTQPELTRKWIRHNEPSTGLLPPRRLTSIRYIVDGIRCWSQSRLLYPEPNITLTTETPELYVFNGEQLYTYLPSRGEAYVHADTRAIPRCRPEVQLGLYRGGKPLSQWLKGNDVSLLGVDEVDSVPCYVLEVTADDGAKTHLWIDTSRGFTPRRIEEYFPDGEIQSSWQATHLKQYSEHLWLPQRVQTKSYSSTAVTGARLEWFSTVCTVQAVHLNPDIPDDLFELHLPDGTFVYDARTETGDIVGRKTPTDEDILNIARLASKLVAGELQWTDVLAQIPGQTWEVPQVGVIGKGIGEPKDAYSGPNSLLIVCGLLGVEATSEELARLAKADQEGHTHFDNLLQAAKDKGLEAVHATLTLNDLASTNKLAIGRIDMQRFVVVIGFKAGKAIIVEPPTLLLFAPISYLDQRWEGEAILISNNRGSNSLPLDAP